MPSTTIFPSSQNNGTTTIKNAPTFNGGDVYLDMIHADGSNVAVANVTFTPCARSYWHTHEKGQILKVTLGSGWVCDKGGKPRALKVGDTVYAPPGTTHWHGAGKGSIMTHFVVGLGKTKWHGAVSDEEYDEVGA